MTNNVSRVNFTLEYKSRLLASVLFSEDIERSLIIGSPGSVMENEVLHMGMTDQAGEIGTKTFRSVGDQWSSITQPGNYLCFRRDRIGRRATSGSANDAKNVRQAKKFSVRQQGCFGREISEWGGDPDGSLKGLTARRAIVEGGSGAEATVGIGRGGSWQRETQRPFNFSEGHIVICQGVAQKGNSSRCDVPIRSSITGHIQELNLVFEDLRKRAAKSLLYIEGGDVFRRGGWMRFKVLVSLVVRHDVGTQGGRKKKGEVRGRNDGIRCDCIPLAQLIARDAFRRSTGYQGSFRTENSIVKLSMPEFNDGDTWRERWPHVFGCGRKHNVVNDGLGKVLQQRV